MYADISGRDVLVELERAPDPALRPGPEEKLVVNKPNTLYYPGPNLSQARELFCRLNRAQIIIVFTRLEESSENFKSLSRLFSLPDKSLVRYPKKSVLVAKNSDAMIRTANA